MKQWLNRIFNLTRLLEIIICISILIAISISMMTLVKGLSNLWINNLEQHALRDFLAIAFNILIGIEFIKMIFKYSVDTIIEVLFFAIARQLIVEHTTVYENFIGVASIALLFVIRKYMFVPELDNISKTE